jgi:nucleoid-associated protein YgaU
MYLTYQMEEKMADPKFRQDVLKEQAKLKAQQAAAQKALAQKAAVQKAASATGPTFPQQVAKEAMRQTLAKVIAKHTIVDDETLTHLSLRYYGHTTEPYWRLIYEFNKAIIGPDYHNIYNGLVLEIPELPEYLKDK